MLTKTFFVVSILLLICETPALPRQSDEERIGFTVAAAPWTLTLPKDGLVVKHREVKPDGQSGYFSLIDEKRRINISFFIEPATDCKDSKACRDMVWKLGNPMWENPQNIVQSEIDGVSYFEFLMPSFQGVQLKQQNMYAEFVRDGFWVDLHISKVLYQPEEHKLFERVIKAIKFEPKNARSPKQE